MGAPTRTQEALRRRRAIAGRLAAARTAAGLSVTDAASVAHVSQWTWRRWEASQLAIPSDLIGDVAKAVRSSVAALLEGDGDRRAA